jgi:serine/threonine-protein kinase
VTELAEDLDLVIGSVIQDRYRVLSRIGEGGVGVVFMVEHTLVGRRYALKVLRQMLAGNSEVIARFHREARAAAAVGNEHIVEVVDMGELENGSPYLVMELLEGRSLSAELEDKGIIPIERAVDIATQCCRALSAAHKKGIVHRDIKPENIFLSERQDGSDFIKILDFGISKLLEAANELKDHSLTRDGTAIGTPQYMSVEQVHGYCDIDARTDVYAMGVVLFRMLTGRAPFDAATYAALVTKIVHDPSPSLVTLRPDLPVALERVVHCALAKDRDERFASTAKLADALAPFGEIDGAPSLTDTDIAFDRDLMPSVSELSFRSLTSRLWSTKAVASSALAGAAILGAVVFAFSNPYNNSPVTTDSSALTRSATARALQPTALVLKSPAPNAHPLKDDSILTAGLDSNPLKERAATESKQATKEFHEIAVLGKPAEGKAPSKRVSDKVAERKAPQTARNKPGIALAKPINRALPSAAAAKRAPIRTVTLHNLLRANITVTLKCGSTSTAASVSALNRVSVAIPQEGCQVSCTGIGGPICPPQLRADASSLDIR